MVFSPPKERKGRMVHNSSDGNIWVTSSFYSYILFSSHFRLLLKPRSQHFPLTQLRPAERLSIVLACNLVCLQVVHHFFLFHHDNTILVFPFLGVVPYHYTAHVHGPQVPHLLYLLLHAANDLLHLDFSLAGFDLPQPQGLARVLIHFYFSFEARLHREWNFACAG